MAGEAAIGLALAGGAAYVATRPAANVPDVVNDHRDKFATTGAVKIQTTASQFPSVVMQRYAVVGSVISDRDGTSFDAELREAEKRMKAEYDRLSSEARKAGAAALNKELGTNFDGSETFEEVTTAVAAIAGRAAGAAACSATGVGAAAAHLCGALGALAGAYLGKKLGGYLSDAWDDVESWVSDRWDDFTDDLDDAWQSTKDYIGGLF